MRPLTVVLVAAATSLAVAQHHEGKRVERAEIQKLEERWRQAELNDNLQEMDHLLSEDFLGITAAGQVVTKAQQLDRVRSHQFDLTELDVSDQKIKISGHIAVVTSLAHLEGTMDGHPLRGNFRYTRIYQHDPGDGWKIMNFEATRVPGGSGSYGMSATAPQASAAGPPAGAPRSGPATPAEHGSPRPQS